MDVTIAKEIQDMINNSVSPELLSHVCNQAASVIPCLNRDTPPTFKILPSLPAFIGLLVKRSGVRAGTLLASLVFLQRLQVKLASIAKGMPCTPHRIFLAALIVTSKSIHDASPKNKHWATYAIHFGALEINLMEKQLLSIMDFDVLISPDDLTRVYREFKETLQPLSPLPLYLHQSINEVDLPMYAAICTSNSSLSSCSSTDSVATVSDTTADMKNYYSIPSKAHCRVRRLCYDDERV